MFKQHPETPFPIGVEYYRAPIPKAEVWDEDFARIRKAGFRIVRSFSYWNWMEPQPGVYELDDFDRLFDLAEKHGLHVWMDITLATHGACPEWLIREYPDMVAVDAIGQPRTPYAGSAYPQGGMIHCYDHPAWEEYGTGLLQHVVNRFKDRRNLLIWGLWDGIHPIPANQEGGLCYCAHTLARYKDWLRERYDLTTWNEHMLRRYRRWEDVVPPRTDDNIIEMMMYRRFHYYNLAGRLAWMVDEVRRIDPHHEVRAHGWWSPRPWDEMCAQLVDSWGMSMPSNNLLTSDDPYKIADRAFIFDLSRSLGVNNRWWNEEIYAGMSRGGVTWKKQTDPRELTTLLWMTLAGGAAGAMFWQYRPEYLSFESPGYNLVALDGQPTPRFEAVSEAIAQIDGLCDHLPLTCPQADVGIVYHPESQELFGFNGETERFNTDLRGVYRTLWRHGVAADVVTPRMDWSGYRLLVLPNVTLMADDVRLRIIETLERSPETCLVAEGSFGLYTAQGLSSYHPPEELAERLGIRVADFSAVTDHDIQQDRNVLETPYGPVPITSPCGYAVLEPLGNTRTVATLDGQSVAVQTGDKRFIWYGLSLSAGFGDEGHPDIVLGFTNTLGINPCIAVTGDPVVPILRRSHRSGWLAFVFNLENTEAHVTLQMQLETGAATDLLTGKGIPARDDGHHLSMAPWQVTVVHFEEP